MGFAVSLPPKKYKTKRACETSPLFLVSWLSNACPSHYIGASGRSPRLCPTGVWPAVGEASHRTKLPSGVSVVISHRARADPGDTGGTFRGGDWGGADHQPLMKIFDLCEYKKRSFLFCPEALPIWLAKQDLYSLIKQKQRKSADYVTRWVES